MIKLKSILFEAVDKSEFIKALEDVSAQSEVGRILTMTDIQEFYKLNQEKINRILSDAAEFKYLGSGVWGVAFSLGDKVLKMQELNQRSDKVLGLYDKQTEKGLFMPKILDHGQLDMPEFSDVEQIDYTILEKFEVVKDERWVAFLQEVMNAYMEIIDQEPSPIAIKKHLMKFKKDTRIPSMSSDLRLKDNWFEQLVDDMISLRKQGILDPKPSNMGIRRVGPEGYFVFFD